MKTLTGLIRDNWLVVAGMLLGAVGGFFYWQEIGCVSGSCPITSNPYISTLYGSGLGGLLFSLFKRENK